MITGTRATHSGHLSLEIAREKDLCRVWKYRFILNRKGSLSYRKHIVTVCYSLRFDFAEGVGYTKARLKFIPSVYKVEWIEGKESTEMFD